MENFTSFLNSLNIKRPTLDQVIYIAVVLAALVALYFLMPAQEAGAVTVASGVIVTGAAGGKGVVDGPLTTSLTEQASPSLLRNEIDRRVVKIRPMATPIDQISRCIGSRPSGSMVVEYYSVDTKETESELAADLAAASINTDNEAARFNISVVKGTIFAPTETLLLPGITLANGEAPVLYVISRTGNTLAVACPNMTEDDVDTLAAGAKKGAKVVRMGRAAAELDVMTEQFEALPTKGSNNCQIFKAQVEQSTFQKIANKEVGWTFSDQEEVAIIDMRLGMEKNFLFGSRSRFTDPVKHEEVLLTGGIWNQTSKQCAYSREALTADTLVSIMRDAFTGNSGSRRKVLVAGSGLIEQLNRLEYNKVVNAGDTVVKWGIDFHEITSKFGSLYVIHSEVFDSCGHSDDGMIIDPEYITKYSHMPFHTESLDLKKSGVRNTEAVVVTESSCLVLRYPSAHCRVVAK